MSSPFPALALGIVAAAAAAALSDPRPLHAASQPVMPFAFRDVNAVTHTAADWANARAVVFFFIMPDCPVSQGYVPEMNRLEQAYAARGIRFYAVQSDPRARAADVRQHVDEFGYRIPVLIDDDQTLIRHMDATVTPETVLMTPSGRVLYQGRIDDRIVSFGNRRPRAARFDLREALDAVLADRPVERPRTNAVGCYIERTPRRATAPSASSP